jgi:hypothetical protein
VFNFYFRQYITLQLFCIASENDCDVTPEKSSQSRKKMFSQDALMSPSVMQDFDFVESKVAKKAKKSYEFKKPISRIPRKTLNEGSR